MKCHAPCALLGCCTQADVYAPACSWEEPRFFLGQSDIVSDIIERTTSSETRPVIEQEGEY